MTKQSQYDPLLLYTIFRIYSVQNSHILTNQTFIYPLEDHRNKTHVKNFTYAWFRLILYALILSNFRSCTQPLRKIISIYMVIYLCHLCNYRLSFLIAMEEIAYYLLCFLLQLHERYTTIVISTITLQENLNVSLVRRQAIFRMYYYDCSSKFPNYFSQSYNSSDYYKIWWC